MGEKGKNHFSLWLDHADIAIGVFRKFDILNYENLHAVEGNRINSGGDKQCGKYIIETYNIIDNLRMNEKEAWFLNDLKLNHVHRKTSSPLKE